MYICRHSLALRDHSDGDNRAESDVGHSGFIVYGLAPVSLLLWLFWHAVAQKEPKRGEKTRLITSDAKVGAGDTANTSAL